ncbi:hypothetical protein ElyMa_001410000 [Elysia marginata]|uniref:Uncharacterized protein n=1 Tax=Elysia marginata TaxID=1093978 RepID=A0AAV4IWX6_9GAST|nr:hypothetical protein ElyMa_001410000 [Elysia marginata]
MLKKIPHAMLLPKPRISSEHQLGCVNGNLANSIECFAMEKVVRSGDQSLADSSIRCYPSVIPTAAPQPRFQWHGYMCVCANPLMPSLKHDHFTDGGCQKGQGTPHEAAVGRVRVIERKEPLAA